MEKKADLVEEARQLRLRQEALAKQAEELEKKVKMARGTARMRKATVPAAPNVIVKPSHGPHWVGDEGSTPELMEAIRALITERPLTFQEIIEATGARDNRIKGAITALQRHGARVLDIAPEGTRRAVWFIPSDAVLERIMRAKRNAAARK